MKKQKDLKVPLGAGLHQKTEAASEEATLNPQADQVLLEEMIGIEEEKEVVIGTEEETGQKIGMEEEIGPKIEGTVTEVTTEMTGVTAKTEIEDIETKTGVETGTEETCTEIGIETKVVAEVAVEKEIGLKSNGVISVESQDTPIRLADSCTTK